MRKQPKQWRTATNILGITIALFCAQWLSARDSSSVIHILVFGDSLSEGLFLKPEEAWPSLLIPKFREAGLEAEIRNVSKSGDTTAGGLERIDRRLKSKIDIFILELGINDAFLGIPVDQIRANLQEIIDRVKRSHPNARLIVCGMKWPDHAPEEYVETFGQIYPDLAKKNNAALVPFLLESVIGDPALNLPDRFHPNAAGHKILAANVWRVLEPVAREVVTQH
jgi:acyl-CoA thioesterase-1